MTSVSPASFLVMAASLLIICLLLLWGLSRTDSSDWKLGALANRFCRGRPAVVR